MSNLEIETVKQEGYAEANRYIANAKDILQKAVKEDRYYLDRKYVRIACGTAYSAVLVALDVWLRLKGVAEPKRKSIDFYRQNIGQLDRKLLTELNTAYNILHLAGYYDGEQKVDIIQSGFRTAYDIIERVQPYEPLKMEEWEMRRRKNFPLLKRMVMSIFM